MKKLDYLKYAILSKLHYRRAWITTLVSITKANKDESYSGQLINEPWGYSFLNAENEIEKIEDSKANEPLFNFSDRIQIDSSWCINAQENIETSIGNLLFNLICITESFGTKLPFITGRVSVGKIEDIIAPRLLDSPSSEEQRSKVDFHVDEYNKFVDSLQFIKALSLLCTVSATPKAILPPTGIKEFKKQLDEKYKGKLGDPIELTKYEKELSDFDHDFVKDDPGYGTFLKGKVMDTARKKMYLNIGSEMSFGNNLKVEPVLSSLNDGWPTDSKSFTNMMNGSRAGSYSRGAETVKGGVSAKYLLRAANNFHIQDTDCGTKLGFERIFTEANVNQLVGRYLIDGNKLIHIENNTIASNYLNKSVILRSPMRCKLDGDNICKICAGDNLNKYPTGVTIPLTEISSIILTASLKLMHTNALKTARMDIKKVFS